MSKYNIVTRHCLQPYNNLKTMKKWYFRFKTFCALLLLSKHRFNTLVHSLFQPPCRPPWEGINCPCAPFCRQHTVRLTFHGFVIIHDAFWCKSNIKKKPSNLLRITMVIYNYNLTSWNNEKVKNYLRNLIEKCLIEFNIKNFVFPLKKGDMLFL